MLYDITQGTGYMYDALFTELWSASRSRIFALDLDARLLPFPDKFSEEYGYTHAFKIGSPSTTKIYRDFLAPCKMRKHTGL